MTDKIQSKPRPEKLGYYFPHLIIPAYFKHLQIYHAPTVNHMYWQEVRHVAGGKHQVILRLKPEAKTWLDAVKLLAKSWVNRTGWKIPDKQVFVIVEVFYFWKDNRFPDANNCHKILLDSLEGEVFQNDKFVLVRDMGVKLDKQNPRIELNFKVLE